MILLLPYEEADALETGGSDTGAEGGATDVFFGDGCLLAPSCGFGRFGPDTSSNVMINPRSGSTFSLSFAVFTPSSTAASSGDSGDGDGLGRRWTGEGDGGLLVGLGDARNDFEMVGLGGDDCDSCGIRYVLLPDVMFKVRNRLGSFSRSGSSLPGEAVSMNETFCGSMSSIDGTGTAVWICELGELTVKPLLAPLLPFCGVIVRVAGTGRVRVADDGVVFCSGLDGVDLCCDSSDWFDFTLGAGERAAGGSLIRWNDGSETGLASDGPSFG